MESFHICPVSSYYHRILLPVSYSLVFLLGLVLNGAQLWCVWCSRTRRWSGTVIYLTHLSMSNLLYVLSLPLLIISAAMGGLWPFGNIMCKSVRFFFLVNLHCSMMFLTCVSVHRFLGVRFPISAARHRSKQRALFASVSVWTLATMETSPTLFFAHTGPVNNMTVCFEMTDPEKFKLFFPYGIFLDIVGFLIPFLVVLTCHCFVMKVLLCSDRFISSRRRNKSVFSLLLVCSMFVVCFVPYHVARTVYLFVRVYMPKDCDLLNVVMISYKVWKPVVSFNCCVNPLLYFWGSDLQPQNFWTWLWRRKRVRPGVVDLDGTHRSSE